MSRKNQMRQCPAAGRPIESFQCASGRYTVYACPESCQFNTFSAANYDQFTSFERAADEKFFEWAAVSVPNRSQFEAGLKARTAKGTDKSWSHYLAWHYVYRTGAQGDTCIGEWEKAGFPGLTNDQRVLMRARIKMRPAIIEAHRILDDLRVEVVDLLDPLRHPFIVADRSFAMQAVRFGVYAVHAIPLPNYHRLFCACSIIPGLPPLESEEVVREIIRHLGGPADEPGARHWLGEHYEKFEEALMAVCLARRKAMFELLDGQFGKAVYELTTPFEECRDRLLARPEIEEDPIETSEAAEGFIEGRVWFATSGDPELDQVGEGATLGRILLGRTHWRLDSMGASRLDRLRERFEALMGDRVRFAGERRDDLSARMRMEDPPYDPKLVPATLLRQPQQLVTAVSRFPAPAEPRTQEALMADLVLQQQKDFLDRKIPALNGRTPREAALDPKLRPELIRLMKERVRDCDTQNLETGLQDDINWMLRELGLNEILFDPPPARPATRLASRSSEETDWDEPETLSLPLPPPLPNRPWTRAEAVDRFDQALKSFPAMTQALDYLLKLDYPLFDYLHEIVGDLLKPREYQFLGPILSLVVLSFAPRGTRPPDMDFDDLSDAFSRAVKVLAGWAPVHTDADTLNWISTSKQPELLTVCLSLLLSLANDAPPKVRPGASARTSYLIIFRVVIDEMDRVLREQQ